MNYLKCGRQAIFALSIIANIPHPAHSQDQSLKIQDLLNIIAASYVDSVDMNRITEMAITSILEELDPHSSYIPADEVENVNEVLQGSFEGIGVQFDIFRDTVFVIHPVRNGPSHKLGIRAGDIVLSADGIDLCGMAYEDDDIVNLLRGKKGSQVRIKIRRSGHDRDIDYLVTRDKIPIQSIDVAHMLNSETAYIKINRFANTTHEEFMDHLKVLKKKGMKDLVLDLRDNSGGYLFSAVEITDELLDRKGIIVSTKGRTQAEQVFYSKTGGQVTNGKLIVLIDEGTASASEILAGAVQDWDRGIIMGRRSFGKGLVMKPYTLSDGSMVRLTTSRYYTPSGRCIQKEYGLSKKEYDGEIMDRYKRGEFYRQDSMSSRAKDEFITSSGRPVYGGGGISPDIFVPADTLLLSDKYQNILKNGHLVEFSIDYTNKHRNKLNVMRSERELLKDDVQKDILSEYIPFAAQFDSAAYQLNPETAKAISIQLTSFVAQHLWGQDAYYKVILSNQPIISQALKALENWELNWEKISQKSN